MPFDWNNLSKGLSRDLARAVGLRVSLAADDLKAKYGEPPTETMVEELWLTLRDRWLASRPASRDRVVTELRKAGLGDAAIKIGSRAGQMEYLRSCRQSNRLRTIVLAAFLEEGSQPMMPPSVMVEQPPPTSAGTTSTQKPLTGLKRQVVELLTQLTGHPPAFDDEGDIYYLAGSTVVYVRPVEPDNSLPMLALFGFLVQGVKETPELYSDLNEANQNLYFCRLVCVNGRVTLLAHIPAHSLTAPELDFVMREALAAADHFDTLLSGRHGGEMVGHDPGEVINA